MRTPEFPESRLNNFWSPNLSASMILKSVLRYLRDENRLRIHYGMEPEQLMQS